MTITENNVIQNTMQYRYMVNNFSNNIIKFWKIKNYKKPRELLCNGEYQTILTGEVINYLVKFI